VSRDPGTGIPTARHPLLPIVSRLRERFGIRRCACGVFKAVGVALSPPLRRGARRPAATNPKHRQRRHLARLTPMSRRAPAAWCSAAALSGAVLNIH